MNPAPQAVPLPHPRGPLAGYRVLDLADEKGQLGARLLAELGADVIKVEPPRDGDPTRQHAPFYRNEAGVETSLYWWTMNAGKRSITLQLRLEAGRELFHRLVALSDIIIETTMPGESAAFGLDYPTIERVNPSAILVSITGFGQTGPYARWQATDIVGSAMGGHMHLNGDPERGPVRTTVPQAYTQVNVQAAVGALVALYARAVNNGIGQHVDVSMQEAMANAMDHAQQTWDIRRVNTFGPGIYRNSSGVRTARYLFETADGWVAALQAGGLIGPNAHAIIDWLAEAGEARGLDSPEWRARLTSGQPLDAADREYVEETMAAFCRTRRKEELVAEAQRRGAGWAPVFGPREIVESRQLAARDYWVRVQHEDLGESFIYPGAPFRLSATPWMQRGRAPHVGEHNEEVYCGLLGLTPQDLRRLRLRMVI
ncbi:CoA transferase [Tepidiforma sp.]|uniref:CaiB/BaiF CoA transferase family protein n=1 Tax=Tepidiforma sp. TaxID=2682230 RepID=UPI002ADDDB24|nr:CoA transferase [Tepidiforma sp.]